MEPFIKGCRHVSGENGIKYQIRTQASRRKAGIGRGEKMIPSRRGLRDGKVSAVYGFDFCFGIGFGIGMDCGIVIDMGFGFELSPSFLTIESIL